MAKKSKVFNMVSGLKDHQFKSNIPDDFFNGYGDRALIEFIQGNVYQLRENYSKRRHGEHLSRSDKYYVKRIFCITEALLKRAYPGG
jgi:hypothetical protein